MENELEKSKQARREQTNEFERKVKEIAEAHNNEVAALKQAADEECQRISDAGQRGKGEFRALAALINELYTTKMGYGIDR